MLLVVLITFFAGIVAVAQLIYTKVSRGTTRFFIAIGTNGPRADKLRYLTPHRGISSR